MKKIFIGFVVILSALAQISPLSLQIFGINANLLLVSLVVLIFVADFYELIWLGLIGGLILDINSGIDFGINMSFYLILLIVIKLIIKKSEITSKLAYILIIILVATVGYNLVLLSTAFKSITQLNIWTLSLQLLFEIVLNILIAIVSYFFITFLLDKMSNSHTLREL